MKKIYRGHGVSLETPYVDQDEAADYMHISLRAFQRLAPQFDVYGHTTKSLYDLRQLDEYMQKTRQAGEAIDSR